MSSGTSAETDLTLSNRPLETLSKLVTLGRPRTWFFSYFAFFAGIHMGGGGVGPVPTVIGLAVFAVWTAGTNLINAYTDVDEDEVNLPDRVSTVHRIGRRRVRNAALACFLLPVVAAALVDPRFGALVAVAALDGYFYSMPPLRLKARPLASLVAFSGAFGFPLMGGYLLASGSTTVPPIIWLMTFWFFTYGTVKNLPDYHGDEEAGLRTPATIFDTQRDAILFAGVVLLTPFPLIVSLALADVIALKYLALLALCPFLVYVLRESLDGSSFEELEIAHTEGFFYAMSFAAAFLLLQRLSVETVALTVAPFAVIVGIHRFGIDSR